MGYTKFVQTWNDFLPFIKITQPSTDLCHTCQKNTEKISRCTGASEEDKISAVEAHQDHLRKAKREREIYNSAVDASKDFLKRHPTISLLSGCYEFEWFKWRVVCSPVRTQGCRKQQQGYLFHTNAIIPHKSSQQHTLGF